MMPTCKEVTRLVGAATGPGGPALATLVRVHLLLCGDCRRYRDELARLAPLAREALREPLDVERLNELERRILLSLPPSESAQ